MFSPVATVGLHLGFSAWLKIWQVPACKMEPRSGYIMQLYHLSNHPAQRISLKSVAACKMKPQSGYIMQLEPPNHQKNDYLGTSIKKVGRYLAEITISWNLRNSDMSLGRWVSEEDVIISKQTFKVLLYHRRLRQRGQKF